MVLYIYTVITALLLVTGQSLWKTAAGSYNVYLKNGASLFKALVMVLFSGKFLIGVAVYIIATFFYLWLFSRYHFYTVQVTLISFSIIFSLFVSYLIFKESMSIINYWGVILIIVGVFLVTWKI